MKVRDLKHWLLNSEVQPEDDLEVISGHTLTVSRDGSIVDCLPIGGIDFETYRKQCYKEFKSGVIPKEREDFFEEKEN